VFLSAALLAACGSSGGSSATATDTSADDPVKLSADQIDPANGLVRGQTYPHTHPSGSASATSGEGATTGPDCTAVANNPASTGHGYSIAFTTCKRMVGAYGNYQNTGGTWTLDPSSSAYAGWSLWFLSFDHTGSDTAYSWIETGFSNSGQGSNLADVNGCLYAAHGDSEGNFDTQCLEDYNGNFPTTGTFRIEKDPKVADVFDVYFDDVYYVALPLQQSFANLLEEGGEEYCPCLKSGPSKNQSPVGKVDDLEFMPQGGSGKYEYWGSYTHCYADLPEHESFGALGYPATFAAQLGQSAGTYKSCDGSVTKLPGSAW
jgi:hypothetical protein